MTYEEYVEIDGWCAGCKIVGLDESTISTVTKKTLLSGVIDMSASVAVVSVSEHEKLVMAKLTEWGFNKGKWFKNWGHGGKRTCLYTYQVSAKQWESNKYNTIGMFDEGW